MLVLARKQDEGIRIADCVKITILEVNDGRVKIGITAPDEISIHREEVWELIQKENRVSQLPTSGLVKFAAGFLMRNERDRSRLQAADERMSKSSFGAFKEKKQDERGSNMRNLKILP
jgi:carbon storage regulator